MSLKYEEHRLDTKRLPFIFRCDIAKKGTRDFTHWHENLEILYITKGFGNVIINFTEHPAHKGDIFVINSENMHMVESDDLIEYYCFIIDTDFCSSFGIPTSELRFIELIQDEKMTEKAQNVVLSFENSGDEFREAKIKYAVLSLLIKLLSFIDKGEKEEDGDHPGLQNIKIGLRYIKEHFAEHITVDGIAEASGLSKAYFTRKFKDITAFTPVNYVNLVRCQNACKMLRTGKYKINEVALACGFDNMSYFTKTYKKFMGVMPSKEEIFEK